MQVTYNRLNRVAEEQVLPTCWKLDLGVLAREPLANGYLTGKYRPGMQITSGDDWRSTHDPAAVQQQLQLVERVQAEEVPEGLPLAQWAIPWCLQHPAVSAVIPGAKAVDQLQANLAAADLDLVSESHPQAAAG